jgi:hypothetical protein
MSPKTFDDLPSRIQTAAREAMPNGVAAAGLESFVQKRLAALGNRSIVEALEQDGSAIEYVIVQCCSVLKRLRTETSARGSLAIRSSSAD